MFDFRPTNFNFVQGDFNVAIAEVTVGEPSLTFRVQLSGLTLGGKRSFSIYTTCPKHPALEYTVPFNPRQPDNVDCAADLTGFLQQPAFCRHAIGPLFERVRAA